MRVYIYIYIYIHTYIYVYMWLALGSARENRGVGVKHLYEEFARLAREPTRLARNDLVYLKIVVITLRYKKTQAT